MEQREFDRLGQEIEDLEEKKDSINIQFQDPSTPYGEIKKLGDDMKKVVTSLEEKEMRWLELLAKTTD
jgi:ATP-binding cassette subfamily F protein uup